MSNGELVSKPPTGWGLDELTSFFEQSNQNQWATFDNRPELVEALQFVDRCYHDIGKDWTNPSQNQLACQLFFRSHIAFKTAAGMAMAGQIAETSPILRVCLEYSMAALRIENNPSLALTFLDRHTTDQARRKSKKEFATPAYLAEVKSQSVGLADITEKLYNNLIDFGGHPNERALSSSMKVRKVESLGTQWLQVGLHADPKYIGFGIGQAVDVGVCSLKILELVFSARFELLGVSERLNRGPHERKPGSRFLWTPDN